MPEQSVYAHLVCPSAAVVQPDVIARIFRSGIQVGLFGFYCLSRQDIGDACLSRCSEIGRLSCVDERLAEFHAELTFEGNVYYFRYDKNNLTFTECDLNDLNFKTSEDTGKSTSIVMPQ